MKSVNVPRAFSELPCGCSRMRREGLGQESGETWHLNVAKVAQADDDKLVKLTYTHRECGQLLAL
jgi:hypothetical protein